MIFIDSPDFNDPDLHNIHDVGVSTLALFGTAQLKEAARSDYKDFNISELKRKIKSILQLQLYLLYRWALTRYMLCHNVKGNFIKQKFFDVTPDSFKPTVADIELYFRKPAFLWRLSAFNYQNLCLLFSTKVKQVNITLKAYTLDSSNMLDYIDNKLSFFSRSMFQSAPTNLKRISTIQEYFKYNLSKYEQSEIYFAQDYFLNMMDATTCYTEFVEILLTGACERYECQLSKIKLDSKGKTIFQFTPNYYVIPEFATDHFADLVKMREKEVNIQNKLILNTNWVEEALCTTMFPNYSFFRLLKRIFGSKLTLNKFKWQDKCGNNVIIGTELPCTQEKEVWLVLKYFTITLQYPWLNCFMYMGEKISKETFDTIEHDFKKIERCFFQLSQLQSEKEIIVMSQVLKEEGKLQLEEVDINSLQSTISSIFDTTFHRNRRKFDNVKTIHPNGFDSLPFAYSVASTTETEIKTNSHRKIEFTYNESSSAQDKTTEAVDAIVCLGVSVAELYDTDISWSFYNAGTGCINPFTGIHGIVNDMMEFTLDLMGTLIQEEAYRRNIFVAKPESIASYLTHINIKFNPKLLFLQKDINRVKAQILKASTQHKLFVENLFKMLTLRDLFEKVVLDFTDEDLQNFPYSSYCFDTQIDEFKDLLESFNGSSNVKVRWFIKPNGFIELLGF